MEIELKTIEKNNLSQRATKEAIGTLPFYRLDTNMQMVHLTASHYRLLRHLESHKCRYAFLGCILKRTQQEEFW